MKIKYIGSTDFDPNNPNKHWHSLLWGSFDYDSLTKSEKEIVAGSFVTDPREKKGNQIIEPNVISVFAGIDNDDKKVYSEKNFNDIWSFMVNEIFDTKSEAAQSLIERIFG